MRVFAPQARAVADDVVTAAATGLRRIQARRGGGIEDFSSRLRDVVVVLSSSRGGSSMLSEILRRSSDLLHLRGELNPFLRLSGLGYPVSAQSDRLTARDWHELTPERRRVLDIELSLDTGNPVGHASDDELVDGVVARWLLQWPTAGLGVDDWTELARRALHEHRGRGGGSLGSRADAAAFVRIAHALVGPERDVLHPHFYDAPSVPGEEHDVAAPSWPHDVVVEEPPMILPAPWRLATASDLSARPLVVKTPSNAYRLPFLRAMFPNARVRVLHLTRNPAASVNGLFDGWLHHGFHAHHMPRQLDIPDYVAARPLDARWWKFDLPPKWEDLDGASLLEVCAFQWESAHRSILDSIDGTEHLRVAFEELQDPATRAGCIERIAQWLDVPFVGALAEAAQDGIEPVVSTVAPRQGRWRERADDIAPVLGLGTRSVARALGYGDDDDWA